MVMKIVRLNFCNFLGCIHLIPIAHGLIRISFAYHKTLAKYVKIHNFLDIFSLHNSRQAWLSHILVEVRKFWLREMSSFLKGRTSSVRNCKESSFLEC